MRRLVFICHASQDAGTAAAIVAGLEERGIGCWMAPRDVPLGSEYAQAIVAGISGASALVLLFSEHANASPHVAREAERAVSRGVPIFPVRVGADEPSATLEYFISSAQWLDISSGDLEEHVSQLAVRLGELVVSGEESSGRVAARDALHQAISRLGPGLADEPRRVEAVLRDLAGEQRAEVAALSVAAAEGVGSALLSASAGMHEGLIEKLTQRLQNNRGLAADVARWAVETWGQVLGVAGHTPPPGADTVPVGDQPLEPSSKPESTSQESSFAQIASQEPDSIDPQTVEPTAPAAAEPGADGSLPSETVPVQSPEPAEAFAPTLAAGESPPAAAGAGTLPLAPDPTPGAGEAVRLAGGSPRPATRWKVAAGVAAAVVALAVVGVLATGGDPDGATAGSGTTTIAGVTTTGGVATTAGVTTTAGATTTIGTASTGAGKSDDPFGLPFAEEFGLAHGDYWTVPRGSERATWDIVEDALSLEAREVSLQTWTPDFDLPNSFVASIEVSQPSLDNVECGLLFKAPDTSRLLFVVNSAEADYDVSRDDDADSGGWESLVPYWRSGWHPAIREAEPNRIELVVVGEELAFRINGDTVMHLSGDDFSRPKSIGPAVNATAAGECRFDDFTVAEFEAPLSADATTPSCSSSGECLTLPYLELFDSRDWVEPWGIESSPLGTSDWDIVAGQLSLDANHTGADAVYFRHRMTSFFGLPSSYVASLDVSQTTESGVSCGLSLNHHDDTFYRFDYLIDSANQEFSVWGPQSRVDYTRTSIVPPTYNSSIRKGDVNRIELLVDGKELAFTANGEVLAEWTREFIDLPQIGPAARVEPGNPEECRFDNYSVVTGD